MASDRNFFQQIGDFFTGTGNGTLSGLLSQISSRVGSFVSDFNSAANSELTGAQIQQNDWSSKQAEEAYARQKEFYELYQSPSALMRQYQEAGMNPALMNGSSVGGSAQSAPQASTSAVSPMFDMMSFLSGVISLFKAKNENKLIDAQAKNVEAQTELAGSQKELTMSQTEAQDIANKFNLATFENNLKKNELDVSILSANLTLAHADSALRSRQLDEISASIDSIRKSIELSDAQIHKVKAETIYQVIQNTIAELTSDASVSLVNSEAFNASFKANWMRETGVAPDLSTEQLLGNCIQKIATSTATFAQNHLSDQALIGYSKSILGSIKKFLNID